MLIPATHLHPYLQSATFPLPLKSLDGSVIVRYLQSAQEVALLAMQGRIIGRAKHKRLVGVQLNELEASKPRETGSEIEPGYEPSHEKGDRRYTYREQLSVGEIITLKRYVPETGRFVRW